MSVQADASVIVKRFDSERDAQLYAWGFAYARRRCKLAPLTIVRDGNQWGVDNPDYREDLHVVDVRGRVERKAHAAAHKADTISLSTGPGEAPQPRPGRLKHQPLPIREYTPGPYRPASGEA
jgi:hypothetical protein